MALDLTEVKYVGSTPAVEVDFDGLGDTTVVFGETISVHADVAVSLLRQTSNWVKPKPNDRVARVILPETEVV